MTFEEIQITIEGMLSVQRNLQENQQVFRENQLRIQENQLNTDSKIDKLTERIGNLTEQVENLNIVSQRHEDRFTQFYGYHQSSDSDRLRLFEMQNQIVSRLDAIEDKLDAR